MRLVEPDHALDKEGGIHGNPSGGPAPGTFTLNCSVELYTYRQIHFSPSPKEEGRGGRKIALKWQASNAAKVKDILQELQASDCDKSHKMAPVRAKCHCV